MKTEYDIVSERNSAECIKIVNQKLSEDWRVVGGVWYGGEYDPVAQAMTRDIPDEPEPAEDMNSKPIGWVMVTERMPEPGLAVLVATYGGRLVAMDALFDNEVWIKSEDKDVTHWMPLPLPPNGKPQPKGQPPC